MELFGFRGGLHSALDGVAWIGEKRRAELFKKFGSLDKIKAASLEELLAVPSLNRAAAESLQRYAGNLNRIWRRIILIENRRLWEFDWLGLYFFIKLNH